MAFTYEKLWKRVSERGLSKMELKDVCQITSSSLSRLSKNQNVSLDILDRICVFLECDVNDIIEHIKHEDANHLSGLRFIDLFAGIGGFRLAGEENGMRCVFSSEIDKYACEVYKMNFGDMPSGDITEIEADDIPDFDVLFAGFPCQPFSYSGQLQGFEDETRGTLFFDIVRILKAKQPKMFLLENIKGLKSHNKGETMSIIIEQLEALGYRVEWRILDSLHYGVPQSRERWYCVGFKDAESSINFNFPEPDLDRVTIRSIIDFEENNNNSLKLSDFELSRINHHFDVCAIDDDQQIRVEHDNTKYESNTKKGKHGVFSYLKPDKSLRFHVGDYAKTQIQEAYYCNLDSYTPSIIASRAPKLWDMKRYLSDRECARLQGFPEKFKLSNSTAQAKKQLGNSVTVPVVSKIIKNMLDALGSSGE